MTIRVWKVIIEEAREELITGRTKILTRAISERVSELSTLILAAENALGRKYQHQEREERANIPSQH